MSNSVQPYGQWHLPHNSVGKESAAMQKTWFQLPSWEDPPEKEMETPSSIFAWRIPRREEPGRVQYGVTRIGHN